MESENDIYDCRKLWVGTIISFFFQEVGNPRSCDVIPKFSNEVKT